jgi:hypothetical protein
MRREGIEHHAGRRGHGRQAAGGRRRAMRLDRRVARETIRERLDQDSATVASMISTGNQLGDRSIGIRRSLRSIAGQKP